MKPTIKVDIVSDVVCPWCYIGKRRFEKAVEQLQHKYNFEIDYKAFELHPDIKDTSTLLDDYLMQKFGSEEQLEVMRDRVVGAANEEGITMNFSKDSIVPNTLLAHKLLNLIEDSSLKANLKEALLKAYFTDNINVGLQEEIEKIAQDINIPQSIIDTFLSDKNVDKVLAEQNHYRQAGVNAVPSFIVNDQYLIQGAQNTETFVQSLEQIANPPKESNACAPGSGCC